MDCGAERNSVLALCCARVIVIILFLPLNTTFHSVLQFMQPHNAYASRPLRTAAPIYIQVPSLFNLICEVEQHWLTDYLTVSAEGSVLRT